MRPTIQTAPDGTRYVERIYVDALLHDICELARNGIPVAIERGVPGRCVYDLLIVAGPDGVDPWPSIESCYPTPAEEQAEEPQAQEQSPRLDLTEQGIARCLVLDTPAAAIRAAVVELVRAARACDEFDGVRGSEEDLAAHERLRNAYCAFTDPYKDDEFAEGVIVDENAHPPWVPVASEFSVPSMNLATLAQEAAMPEFADFFPEGGTPDYAAEFQRHIYWTIGGTSPSLPDQVLRVNVYPIDVDEGMDVHAGFRIEVCTRADGQPAPGIEPWIVRNRGYASPTRLNGKLVFLSLLAHGIKPEWQD